MNIQNEVKWNPLHGCKRCSPGCKNCWVYSMDLRWGRDTEDIQPNESSFRLPVFQDRYGFYKYPSGTVFATCFTSDFFLPEADRWREDMWNIIRARHDCAFFIITKRVSRIFDCLPRDWSSGWDNVWIGVSCENQQMTDIRLKTLIDIPLKHRAIIAAPLLEKIDFSKYLSTGLIEKVSVGGESGFNARPMSLDWVKDIRQQCIYYDIGFEFRQTGASLYINGELHKIAKADQKPMAAGFNLDYNVDGLCKTDSNVKNFAYDNGRLIIYPHDNTKTISLEMSMDEVTEFLSKIPLTTHGYYKPSFTTYSEEYSDRLRHTEVEGFIKLLETDNYTVFGIQSTLYSSMFMIRVLYKNGTLEHINTNFHATKFTEMYEK